MMPMEVFGSRLPVGSSAIRIIGRFTNARAMATRCCSPPESSSGIRWPLPSRPTISRVSGTTLLMWERGLPITCSAKPTLSVTVLLGSSRKSWKTVPMLRRRLGTFQLASRLISLPATNTRPCVGRASRSTSRRKVDFPEPDSPTRKTNSPFSTSTLTSSSAGRLVAPYCLETFSNRITIVGSGRRRGQGTCACRGEHPIGQGSWHPANE